MFHLSSVFGISASIILKFEPSFHRHLLRSSIFTLYYFLFEYISFQPNQSTINISNSQFDQQSINVNIYFSQFDNIYKCNIEIYILT